MKLRLAVLSLVAVGLVAGCSDDAAVRPTSLERGPIDVGPEFLDTEDERFWDEESSVVTRPDEKESLARRRPDHPLGVHPTHRAYEITVENLTENRDDGAAQVLSPPVLATHQRSLRMFRVGRYASQELAGIAEDALNQPMIDLLEASDRTAEVVAGDAPIPPGASATFTISSRAGRRALSMAFMLVNTNDGFSGLDAARLPARGEVTYELHAYDAGSEVNDELEGSIPGPCCGVVGEGTDEQRRIRMHEGITGRGDLDPAVWGWTGPVARVTIKRLAPAYRVTVRNLTPDNGNGAAQVFSPPVVASHSRRIAMFRVGRHASDELAGIAEDALNQPMVDLLESTGLVNDLAVGDGPIVPGAEASFEIEAAPRQRRLSMVFMLVNTNDAFSGIDRVFLPRTGSATYRLRAWDAGSEVNDELAANIPGPCCGSVGSGEDEFRRIGPHEGIVGRGDLEPETYDWDEPAAELEIVRIR